MKKTLASNIDDIVTVNIHDSDIGIQSKINKNEYDRIQDLGTTVRERE